MEKTRKRAAGGDGRDRPRKAPKPVFDRTIQPPAGLVAKNPPPQPKLKHQAYFEFVENTNKKKQLDYQVDPNSPAEGLAGPPTPYLTLISQITVDKEPPPGFAFVPIGNPELTTLCKEISREKDAMIFMVSVSLIFPETRQHRLNPLSPVPLSNPSGIRRLAITRMNSPCTRPVSGTISGKPSSRKHTPPSGIAMV